MKKILRNIVLLLLPIVLYYTVFIIFEPNNYFGLWQKASGTDIMASLRAYQSAPQDHIILGDSRTAQLDAEIQRSISGVSYANLSYGGASLEEQLDLLDWARQTNPNLQTVVFSLSFYTLNKGYTHNRNVIMAVNNPLVYLTNLGYNINMFTNLLDYVTGREIGAAAETMPIEDFTYVEYTIPITGEVVQMRKKVAEHMVNLTAKAANWQLNEEGLTRLLQSIDECTARGIEFILVLPPAHPDVIEHLVRPYGIEAPMLDVLERLHASPALVLDYELTNRPDLRDDQFFDGFHLDTVRGIPAFTQLLFTAIQQHKGA